MGLSTKWEVKEKPNDWQLWCVQLTAKLRSGRSPFHQLFCSLLQSSIILLRFADRRFQLNSSIQRMASGVFLQFLHQMGTLLDQAPCHPSALSRFKEFCSHASRATLKAMGKGSALRSGSLSSHTILAWRMARLAKTSKEFVYLA